MTQYASQLAAMNVIEVDRDAWLEERSRVIGGTDVARTLSNPEGALEVYSRKIGLMIEDEPDDDQIAARELGLVLERPIAEYWAKKNSYDLVAAEEGKSFFCRHPDLSFIAGSPDFFLARNGEIVSGLEIKTRNEFDRKFWDSSDTIPLAPLAQASFYALIAKVNWFIVPLVGVHDIRTFPLERDEAFENQIVEIATGLHRCIESKTPPPLMYGKVTTEYLKAKYSTHNAELVRLDGELDLLLTEGFEVHAQKKALEEREDFIKAVMLEVMKESGGVQGTAGVYKMVCGRKDKIEVDAEQVVARLCHDYSIPDAELEKIKLESQRTVKGFFRGLWKENK